MAASDLLLKELGSTISASLLLLKQAEIVLELGALGVHLEMNEPDSRKGKLRLALPKCLNCCIARNHLIKRQKCLFLPLKYQEAFYHMVPPNFYCHHLKCMCPEEC